VRATRGPAPPWLLVVLAAAAIVARAPVYLVAPNFWAEEGTFFYVWARTHHWWETVFFAPAGYYLLWANVAGLLGALAPVVEAPLVTKLAAFAVQLVPVALIAAGEAPLWQAPWRREIGIAAVLFGSLSGEIWLATVNSQSWLALVAVLVLLEPAPRGRRAWVLGALLALAGLTGPVACFLLPLFVWRAWRTRARAAIVQAAVLAGCASVQAAVVAHTHAVGPARLGGLGVGAFAAAVWMKALVLPTLGVIAAERFTHGLAALLSNRLDTPAGVTVGCVLLVLAAAMLDWLARGARRDVAVPLVGAFVLVTALSIVFAVEDKRMLLGSADNSSRYFYVPGVVLLLLLLENVRPATRAATPVRHALCVALLVAGIVGGVVRWRSTIRWRPGWPVWRTEVAAWHADPRRQLAIWPPPRWAIRLDRQGVAE